MAETKKAGSRTPARPGRCRRAEGPDDGFTAEERSAMQDRVKELKRARSGARGGNGEQDVLEKIATMPEPDRAMAERVHSVIMAACPDLQPRTWYGMPAYSKDGNILCFFRGAHKFKTRYATLGFSDKAHLDEGSMWPTDFAVARLSKAEEERISELVKRAVG